MRKRIKATGFSDWDSMFYNNLLSVPVLIVFSLIFEDWGSENLARNLCVPLSQSPFHTLKADLECDVSQPGRDAQLAAVRHCVLWCRRRWHLIHDGMVHPRNEQHDLLVRPSFPSVPYFPTNSFM